MDDTVGAVVSVAGGVAGGGESAGGESAGGELGGGELELDPPLEDEPPLLQLVPAAANNNNGSMIASILTNLAVFICYLLF
ncbi:MAG: hypothetical protein HZB81_01730 [Deltaproteobacteria bacterium]|nr:hypothetical protein [Deltaproteobacteria bacterium]